MCYIKRVREVARRIVHGRVNVEHVDTGQRGMWFDQCSYWRVFTTHLNTCPSHDSFHIPLHT